MYKTNKHTQCLPSFAVQNPNIFILSEKWQMLQILPEKKNLYDQNTNMTNLLIV